MEASEISHGIDTQEMQEELMKISPTQLGLKALGTYDYEILGEPSLIVLR